MSESASLCESGVPNVEVDGYDPRVGHAKTHGRRPCVFAPVGGLQLRKC